MRDNPLSEQARIRSGMDSSGPLKRKGRSLWVPQIPPTPPMHGTFLSITVRRGLALSPLNLCCSERKWVGGQIICLSKGGRYRRDLRGRRATEGVWTNIERTRPSSRIRFRCDTARRLTFEKMEEIAQKADCLSMRIFRFVTRAAFSPGARYIDSDLAEQGYSLDSEATL